jgi:hypothetical protein
MSARVHPVEALRPFVAAELFGFHLRAPVIVPAPGREAESELLREDIRADKLELARAVKRFRGARDDAARRRAAEEVATIKRRLLRVYLKLQRYSIGYRYAGGEVESWPKGAT